MSTLVLGAGMAGLTVAATLRVAGAQQQILEPRGRMAGSVHTDRRFAGVSVEFGAAFAHGDTAPT